MRRYVRLLGTGLVLAMAATLWIAPRSAAAATTAEVDADVDAALGRLYGAVPEARTLAERARGVLVFPSIVKVGFIGGAQFGEGALRVGGKTAGYYHSFAGSYGFQAGIERFGYALFFMSDSALRYLDTSGGWEIGTGPNIAIVDAGMAKALTTTTLQHDIYAFFFHQRGLFAGVGLQGSKITRIDR